MKKKYFTRILTGSLLALLCTLPAAAANLAGTAVFVSGKPTATDPAGGIRELKARDEVYSGDLLETTRGRVQIKFVDGAFMSIQPNSRFQIEDYNYANGSDGSEKAVYNLFKGGMRAFTGAIGKKHTDAYKVKTPVATIGIRGTGHNTRICSGDCTSAAGLPLPDGLYHSTWEGTTYVENDFGTSTVPFGNSVYVQSIDSPAEETNEASQVTAVQPSEDTVEELAEEQEEQTTLEAGEQLTSDGTPVYIPPPPDPDTIQPGLNQVTDQTLIGIEPTLDPATEDGNAGSGIIFDTTVLVGADSARTNGTVGAIGMELDDNGLGNDELYTLITIDPNGIRDISEPNSAVAVAQGFINDALDGGGPDADAVNDVIANPATVAEYTVGTYGGSNYGFVRWTNGNVLFIDEDINTGFRTVEVDNLALANQSLNLLNSDTPDTDFGAGATGTYNLLGGTRSTTTHSGGLGSGVQPGSLLAFDFTTLNGIIAMEILHGATFLVNGALQIDTDRPGEFFDVPNGVWAVADDDTCGDRGCETFLEGSFFGSLAGADGDGAPWLAGLDYEIITTEFDTETPMAGDSIIGNAIFGRGGTADPIPSVIPGQGLILVLPIEGSPEFALIDEVTNIVGGDSMNNPGLLTIAGMQTDGEDDFFGIATIDPEGLLAVDSPDQNVVDAQDLIEAALDPLNPDIVVNQENYDSVINSPAKIEEYFQSNGFAFVRWANGNVMSLNADGAVEVLTLMGNQSLHAISGDTPELPGQNATGTYTFFPGNGTRSTSFSGATIGDGVIDGTLTFDFDNPLGGAIDMIVRHGVDYNVAGGLEFDFGMSGNFFDDGEVTATTGSGTCAAGGGCITSIHGGFAGALSDTGGGVASPAYAGLEYEIYNVDGASEGIMGVAAFGRTGPLLE